MAFPWLNCESVIGWAVAGLEQLSSPDEPSKVVSTCKTRKELSLAVEVCS